MAAPTDPTSTPTGPDERRSRVASGIKPRPIRFLFKDSQVRVAVALAAFFLACVPALGIAGALLVASLKIKAGVIGLILLAGAAIAGLLGILFLVGARNLYSKDLGEYGRALTPAVVVSHRPTVVVGLVDMGRDRPGEFYWATRMDFTRAFRRLAVGTRIPCYAVFQDKQDDERWRTADVHPMLWGTGDAFDLQHCLDLIGEAEFAKLETCIRSGRIPEHAMHHILLDGSLQVLASESYLRPDPPAPPTP